MKPLYLTIEGVKSVAEEQKINFERVAKNGIFGIFGKTGSGKSTILDAIVLALYGSVVSNVDNSEFVNKGKNLARVNLTFSVTAGGGVKKYRVERVYKFSKDRKNLTSTAKLFEFKNGDEYLVCDGAASVTNVIKNEIIGLEKADFLKCIALPQGEFSAFVKMSRGERLKVVGKLFNLERYGDELARKTRAKLDGIKVELSNLEGRLSQLEQYSTEKLATLEKQLAESKNELDAKRVEYELVKQEEKRVVGVASLIKEREEKLNEFQKKLAYKAIIDAYEQEIALFDKVNLHRESINGYLENGKKIEIAKREAEQLAVKKAELDKKIGELKNQENRLPEMQEKLDLLKVKQSKLEDVKIKQEKLEKYRKQIEEFREEYKAYKAEREKYLAQKEEAQNRARLLGEKANACDVQKVLSGLSERLSQSAVKELALSQINFLKELVDSLSSALLPESKVAVNQLIAARIDKLSRILEQKEEGDLKEELSLTVKKLDELASLKSLIEKAIGESNACDIKIANATERLEMATKEGVKAREQFDELNGEINLILGGENYFNVSQKTKKEIDSLNAAIQKISADNRLIGELIAKCDADIARNGGILTQLCALQANCEKTVKLLSQQTGMDFDKLNLTLSNEQEINKKRLLVANYKTECAVLEKRIGELNLLLANSDVTQAYADEICAKSAKIGEEFEKITKIYGEISFNYKISLKNNEEWCIINNNISRAKEEYDLHSSLYVLVKEGRFMEFVAEEYLCEIASDGENRLLNLTGGVYGLCYRDGNFFVTDNLRGGVMRPIGGLSGGETFLVSLSLALALSSQISQKALKPIDFFFLDEGFGTLDDELIETVTDSLEKLQRANLTVGLITHVTELKNRIQSKIYVTGATLTHGTLISDRS